MMDANDKHSIFSTDPAEWMKYFNKKVCVTTVDKVLHTGWTFTVDPVSQSIVLVNFENDNAVDVEIVMGQFIKSITLMGKDKYTGEIFDQLFKSGHVSPSDSTEPAEVRIERLRQWLVKNRLPVEMTGENSDILHLPNMFSIVPPYGPENCRCTNQIILNKIQELIKSVPSE